MGEALFSLFTRTSKIKLIIFDFDGTLCDSIQWFSLAINGAATRFNFKVTTESEVQFLRGLGTREIMSHLGIPWWKVPFIASYMRANMKENLSTINTFHGINDLLTKLKEDGFTLALVSSNSRHNVSQVLGIDLLDLFTHLEFGTSLFGKESKFKKMIRASGFESHDVISIGDEVRDVEAARALGIRSMAVTWGYASKKALIDSKPDDTVDSIEELLSKLLNQPK